MQGPVGNAGLQGVQGPQGFQGVTGPPGTENESFVLVGTFNGTTNVSRYLNGPDGVAMDAAPMVMPFDVELVAMSATSEQGASTAQWDAQVYVNGALLTGASINLNNVDKAYQSGFPTVATISANDEVALYANNISGGIRKARINAWFRRV